jgi:hypothetical protein
VTSQPLYQKWVSGQAVGRDIAAWKRLVEDLPNRDAILESQKKRASKPITEAPASLSKPSSQTSLDPGGKAS